MFRHQGASPVRVESQGTLQSLSAPASTTSAPVTDIATFRPAASQAPTAIRPSFERRPLTSDEKNWLLSIMHKRGMSTTAVMDELGLPRRDYSLWMALRQGTKVSGEMLERLSKWLDANVALIPEVA